MKSLLMKAAVAVALLLIATPAARAYVERFGDFDVVEDFERTGVILFIQPDSASNPAPFADPTTIDEAAVYPTRDREPLTVRNIRDRLGEKGLNTDTFGIGLVLEPRGKVTMSNLQITAGDELLAISEGVEEFESDEVLVTTIGFLPDLNLDSADPDAEVLVSYNLVGSFDEVPEMEMVGVPEPLSMLLFATGLAAVVITRRRRK